MKHEGCDICSVAERHQLPTALRELLHLTKDLVAIEVQITAKCANPGLQRRLNAAVVDLLHDRHPGTTNH